MKVHPVQRLIFSYCLVYGVVPGEKEKIRHWVSSGPTKESYTWECFWVTLWSSNKNRSLQSITKSKLFEKIAISSTNCII